MKLLRKQRGMALIMLVFIVGLAATAYLMHALNPTTVKIDREKKTAAALAEAKDALIGWSIKNNTPGQLPCPEDTSLIGGLIEGQASSTCSNSSSTIGRLAWRTLGLGDLRDGYGERLWYVLSPGFRSGIINSDTPAQLSVDGQPASTVAIIFSAGPALSGLSRPFPTAATPPAVTLYLDLSNNDGDNNFVTSGDAVSFNDQLLLVKQDELFKEVEKRVAGEALNCLRLFALANGGKLPWPDKLDPTAFVDYIGDVDVLFGRLADSPMSGSWSGGCKIPVGGTGWWLNWKEQVFYALADEYKPTGAAVGCGACLTVNAPFANVNKKVVVLIAGKALAGQNRFTSLDKGTLSNYLEDVNSIGGVLFVKQNATTIFNDMVVYH